MQRLDNSVNYSFNGKLARKYGVTKALILNRIIWSINSHIEDKKNYEERFYLDGRWWMSDTTETIAAHYEGILSHQTIRKSIRELETDGILIARKARQEKWDQTKWYSIDHDILNNSMTMDLVKNTTSRAGIKQHPDLVKNTTSSSLNSLTYSHTNNHSTKPPAKAAVCKFKYSESDYLLAARWLEHAKSKSNSPSKAWTQEYFAHWISKGCLYQGKAMTPEQKIQFFEFILQDEIWGPNCLSPRQLLDRKNKDEATKGDKIINKMEAHFKNSKQFQAQRAYQEAKANIEAGVNNSPF